MQRHTSRLLAANPSYFANLEAELRRPSGELFRCNCPERFVSIRRSYPAGGPRAGRSYYMCEMRKGGDHRSGCSYFAHAE